MKVSEIVHAVSGRKVDVDGGKWFGARMLHDGGPSKSEPIGTMPALDDAKPQDWSAVERAWSKPPEPTLEGRLRALEEQT